MQKHVSSKAAILTVIVVLAFFVSLELYLRSKGAVTGYDDGPELWGHSREMVYEPADKATVFTGSSRIKYDLDIPTWERLTGNHAIQLAMVASSPRLFLTDLADDPKFKGKLIVDVTEVLFFSHRGNSYPDQFISYYKKRTPAQRASFVLNKPIESRLVFLSEGHYAINALLGRLHISDRPGIYPFLDFPSGFDPVMYNRQDIMTPEFVADTNQHNQVKAIWGLLKNDPTPPMSGKDLDSVMLSVKNDVNKIRARGGDVIFTRTPSTGFFWMAEQHMYPRKAYWDRLLAETGCKGIYFGDYPTLAKLDCPELSHLSQASAVIYTTNLVNILETEKGWSFSAR
ncbi:hypothetical protein ACPPVU_06150 [Mucilaginibacter sp. McL0603]|uniref:hypothetical protein n=1 Tax=Mucilaginibacter sp. McL0603 TaxID=3415670 RepID=UPI003CF43984